MMYLLIPRGRFCTTDQVRLGGGKSSSFFSNPSVPVLQAGATMEAASPKLGKVGIGRTLASCMVILGLSGPSILTAQAVEGRLFDDETEEPITGARVMLLDPREEAVREALTDDHGAFRLPAPTIGRYQLRASRIGYQETTSPPLDVQDGETVEVELRLSTEAIPLAPLTVVSERPPLVLNQRLLRRGFYEREGIYGKMGFGRFLHYEEIRRRIISRTSDVLRDLPGMRVRSAGGRRVQVTTRRGCSPTFYLDGVRFPLGGQTIDDIVMPTSLVAVEVYPGPVSSGEFPGGCGAVVLWTGIP